MAKPIRKYGLFIDGKENNSISGKTYIRENPKGFSIQYSRKAKTRGICESIEERRL